MSVTTREVKKYEGQKFHPAATGPVVVRPRAARSDWMQSHPSNKALFIPNPSEKDIILEDIAHHLSMQCRFNGAVEKFYSVAEHCVRVSWVLDWSPRPASMTEDERAAVGLMHDAQEYVLGDLITPMKQMGEFAAYKKFEAVWELAILRRFKLKGLASRNDEVIYADGQMCHHEKIQLKGPAPLPWKTLPPLPGERVLAEGGPLGWAPAYAKKMFLDRASSLGLR